MCSKHREANAFLGRAGEAEREMTPKRGGGRLGKEVTVTSGSRAGLRASRQVSGRWLLSTAAPFRMPLLMLKTRAQKTDR